MRILLVKTSSLGDVVHNLPVVSDIRRNFPDARIDWTVDGSLAEIPRMHPGIDEVVWVAPRRWRRSLLSSETWREIGALRTAEVGRARVRHDHRYASTDSKCRDHPPRLRYTGWAGLAQRTRAPAGLLRSDLRVPWDRHAVERNRLLAALALGYRLESKVDYGIQRPLSRARRVLEEEIRSRPFAVLLHATSATAKLWPEDQWVKLGDHLQKWRDKRVALGKREERARSERLANRSKVRSYRPAHDNGSCLVARCGSVVVRR